MFKFVNAVELRKLLSKNNINWLLLIDFIPAEKGDEYGEWIWECAEEVLLEEKGDYWKDAVYIHSAQALELLEGALIQDPVNKIYLNNTLIQRQ